MSPSERVRLGLLRPNLVFDCVGCGDHVERYVAPSLLAAGKAKGLYCGLRCKGIALSGSRHPRWRGGRVVNDQGYILVHRPDHPAATAKGYVREHRLVMEGKLGRPLEPDEVVHHINGVRSDNRPENFAVYPTNAEHKRDDITLRRRDEFGRLLPEGTRA